jgi:hypothetical protein
MRVNALVAYCAQRFRLLGIAIEPPQYVTEPGAHGGDLFTPEVAKSRR